MLISCARDQARRYVHLDRPAIRILGFACCKYGADARAVPPVSAISHPTTRPFGQQPCQIEALDMREPYMNLYLVLGASGMGAREFETRSASNTCSRASLRHRPGGFRGTACRSCWTLPLRLRATRIIRPYLSQRNIHVHCLSALCLLRRAPAPACA